MSKEKTKHAYKVATLATRCNYTDYQAQFVAPLYKKAWLLQGCYRLLHFCIKIVIV